MPVEKTPAWFPNNSSAQTTGPHRTQLLPPLHPHHLPLRRPPDRTETLQVPGGPGMTGIGWVISLCPQAHWGLSVSQICSILPFRTGIFISFRGTTPFLLSEVCDPDLANEIQSLELLQKLSEQRPFLSTVVVNLRGTGNHISQHETCFITKQSTQASRAKRQGQQNAHPNCLNIWVQPCLTHQIYFYDKTAVFLFCLS